jgi:hypothetical protein
MAHIYGDWMHAKPCGGFKINKNVLVEAFLGGEWPGEY